MKAYEKNEVYKFAYPEEMKMILDYLNAHGKILVKESTIEDLYFDFSLQRYDAGWMRVDEELLEEFEDWLTGIEL